MNCKTLVFVFFVFISIVIGFSCAKKESKNNSFDNLSKEKRMELSQNSMKSVLIKEKEQINQFIKRKGGDFTETKTGVHYFIYQKNNLGKSPNSGKIANLHYILTLLSGDTIANFSIKTDQIAVEFDHKESGLHEVIKLIKTGEKAIVIIPSHCAHGFTGNDVDIPPLSTLVYNIELIDFK